MTTTSAPERSRYETSGQRFDVASIKREHPLSSLLASSGVRLLPTGKGTFRALCPLHADSDPSLLIDDRDGHFHCFGCQAHGDVIDFVRRRDGVTFVEACSRLTALPAQSPAGMTPHLIPGPRRWERLRLEEQVVMNVAGVIYQRSLWREERALAYLRNRGIPDWLIHGRGLGYADGHSLEAYLRRRSGLRVAQSLGLLRRREGGDDPAHGSLREFLASRVVVPEIRGNQVIWLIGRTLKAPAGRGVEGGRTDGEPGVDDRRTVAGPEEAATRVRVGHERAGRPKYLGLPGERPVLGFELAAGRREVFLCEGIFDWLTALAWRLPAFSTGGTHLSADRLGFLARARVVWGIFDADEAGRTAAARFRSHLGERFQPLELPEGYDLNDLGCEPGGRAEFFHLLAAARRRMGEPVRADSAVGTAPVRAEPYSAEGPSRADRD
jgi:DNA primase